ncbi:MAG: MgtC/SapB family protein [Desulfomonilia bacterium]
MQGIWYLDEPSLFLRFGIALLIGILVGIQREYAFGQPEAEHAAGIRTFALMGLVGCAAALASDFLQSPLPFMAIILVIGAFFTATYFVDAWRGQAGLTTEISALVTVLSGALVYWGKISLGIALGVVTTVLLSIKPEMHRFVGHLTREDLYATLKLAVITAIVLPVLPNRNFGPPPFDVFNPFVIWLLVVFISGMSFIGYVLIQMLGAQKGMGLTGLLGGIASSTAVTFGISQQSRREPHLSRPFAMALLIAWTVMLARIIVIVLVLNRDLALLIWKPLLVPIFAGTLYALFLFVLGRSELSPQMKIRNPFEIWPAITFGIVFTIVLFVAQAAQIYLGDRGIYLTSFISGLADVDAITLSLAGLSHETGGIPLTTAARAVVFASLANTLLKGFFVLGIASPGLRRTILPGFLFLVVSLVIAVFLT